MPCGKLLTLRVFYFGQSSADTRGKQGKKNRERERQEEIESEKEMEREVDTAKKR